LNGQFVTPGGNNQPQQIFQNIFSTPSQPQQNNPVPQQFQPFTFFANFQNQFNQNQDFRQSQLQQQAPSAVQPPQPPPSPQAPPPPNQQFSVFNPQGQANVNTNPNSQSTSFFSFNSPSFSTGGVTPQQQPAGSRRPEQPRSQFPNSPFQAFQSFTGSLLGDNNRNSGGARFANRPTPAQGSLPNPPTSVFNLGGQQPSFSQPQQTGTTRFPEPQFGGFRPVKKRHTNNNGPEERTGKHNNHASALAAKHHNSARHSVGHVRNNKSTRHSNLRPAQSRKDFSVYNGGKVDVAQKRMDYDDDYSDYDNKNNVEDYYYYYEYYD